MANPAPLTPAARRRVPLGALRSRLPLALAPLLLAGCAPTPPPVDPTALIPPPPAAPAAPAKGEKAGKATAADAGLQPLATPQQVINSVDLGRRDPFGRLIPPMALLVGPDGKPLSAAAMAAAGSQAGTPPGAAPSSGAAAAPGRAGRAPLPALPPLQLPTGFAISGVIRSGGVSEAVVSYGALSGILRPGDRGGRTTDLLPSGWSVASIDVNRGTLTLQRGGQRVTAEL